MDTVLITGGEIPEYKYVKDLLENKFVCVADSGLDWVLKNDISFDHIVGDMDSISDISILNNISKDKITLLPKDKDDTDTVYGLKYLKKIGASHITLIGGGGGRLDHLLGIVSLFRSNLAPDCWYTHKELVIFVKGLYKLDKYFKYNISVIPLGENICRIQSYGLKWDLNKVNWQYKSIGISNYIERSDAWIDTGENSTMLILPIEGRVFE